MRNPHGYATQHVDGVLVEEQDTVTCGHCSGIVYVPPGNLDTWSCRACDSHICESCARELAKTLKCVTIEERLQAMERSDALMRSLKG